MMEVKQLAKGFWRWTAPHPEWRPEKGGLGGWEREVGCVYYETPPGEEAGIILIDPMAPPAGTEDGERFLEGLDRDVRRMACPVSILLTGPYHQRSAGEMFDRYRESAGAAVWAPETARGRITCSLHHAFRAGDPLPGRLTAHEVLGPEKPECALFIPEHRALVLGDALIGTGEGRVRLAPPSWAEAGAEGEARYRGSYRDSLRPLLDLPVEILLVSHGAPVLERGRAALKEALETQPWGDV
jgi:glyoxylase-like metal-dependent hydrolase (beta-lactamase superfamily II)